MMVPPGGSLEKPELMHFKLLALDRHPRNAKNGATHLERAAQRGSSGGRAEKGERPRRRALQPLVL